MKRFCNPLISIAAPLLVALTILGFVHREGREKVQVIPAFVFGSGLVVTGTIRRLRRRRMLLLEIKKSLNQENY